MERGNAKHGAVRDEEMARETEAMVRGAPQRPHTEQWRETEPLDDGGPAAERPRPRASLNRDMELRSELARIMTRDAFPVGRDTLADMLADAGAPADLAERVLQLPAERDFTSVHEILEALGLSSPETHETHER